jgi:solute carrier family 25 phosphate transporter 3
VRAILEQYYELPIFLVSTLGAVCVTCLLACPFESARVRLMARLGSKDAGSEAARGPTTLGEMLVEMLAQGGGSPLALWSGLPPLVLRETLFSIPKFLVFNWASSALGAGLQTLPLPPSIADSLAATLSVSLLAGALAGVAGAIVSSPADALLTKSGGGATAPPVAAIGDGGGGADEKAKDAGGMFAGAGVRCLFFAASISVQFLLYDAFRAALHVSPQDLMEGLDVFADRLSFYPGPTPGP